MRLAVVLSAAAALAATTLAFVQSRPVPTLKPGDLAPSFSLPGSDGRTYGLEQYRGKQAVVLAWFPKAFTGG